MALASVFFYVGPDEDVVSLIHMSPEETTAIYVEPLVAWRNFDRIKAFQHDEVLFDMMFECETVTDNNRSSPYCVTPLTLEHVRSYFTKILRNLVDASKCSVNSEYNALRDLQIINATMSLSQIYVRFVSMGITRTLKIILKRIQDITITDVASIVREKVSSFSYIGVEPNMYPAKEFICPYATRSMNVLTSLDDDRIQDYTNLEFRHIRCPRERMNILGPYNILLHRVNAMEFCRQD